MIDKRISLSKKLAAVSDRAKVLWFMIYPHLDKEGKIAFDDLDDLRVECFPYFSRYTNKAVAKGLNELADVKLIILYPHDKKIALKFTRFNDFQTIREDREAKSEIPNPETQDDNAGVRLDYSGSTPLLSLSLSLTNELSNKAKERVVYYCFDSRSWKHITDKDKEKWKEAYPACDIRLELLKAGDWLVSNPSKVKSNYRRFITNWLSRTQDHGGTKKGSTPGGAKGITGVAKRWAEKGSANG